MYIKKFYAYLTAFMLILPACSKRSKTVNEMDYKELKEHAIAQIEDNNKNEELKKMLKLKK